MENLIKQPPPIVIRASQKIGSYYIREDITVEPTLDEIIPIIATCHQDLIPEVITEEEFDAAALFYLENL